MDTPICDFVQGYAASDSLRLHMPGHKGHTVLGVEHLDITEISGADNLYEADGVIAESENNASELFGCPTFYSTEGSSQCIRAMLFLGRLVSKRSLVAAGRNAHKTFLSAAALLDLDVLWLQSSCQDSYLNCSLMPGELEQIFHRDDKPGVVYITSPDYLGRTADISGLAQVCHRHGALLLVDNAHGAYLRFLPQSQHPMDLGADICCDSAHKTLPVLTGGAYLHISQKLNISASQVKNALALFGSTSPSYLILQSLDVVNLYLADVYRQKLAEFIPNVIAMKNRLAEGGYHFYGDEHLKLTIMTKHYGYEGTALASYLAQQNIECEFADPDHLVLMLTPELGSDGLAALEEALLSISAKKPIEVTPPAFSPTNRVLSIRDACFSPSETVDVELCEGRILAAATVGCPPAVPIAVCGELIDKNAINCFRYYGIRKCCVVLK